MATVSKYYVFNGITMCVDNGSIILTRGENEIEIPVEDVSGFQNLISQLVKDYRRKNKTKEGE